jgi:hypothetical protein
MVGFVTTRHWLTHPVSIVRERGMTCLLRCHRRRLTAGHAVTFLEGTVPGGRYRHRPRNWTLAFCKVPGEAS